MIGRLRREARFAITAVVLLTRLPAPRLAGYDDSWLARSATYFPVVGLVVGALAAGTWMLCRLLWPAPVAAVLAVAAAAAVSGLLHEDGWADVFDGMAAGGGRERFLEVMRDSRVGAAGALALTLLVAGKLTALLALPQEMAAPALIAAHVLSRWSSLPLLCWLPYARPEGGLAGPLAGRLSGLRLAAGTVLGLGITAVVLRSQVGIVWLAAALATLVGGLYFRSRLGGITGDALGATNQWVELWVLLALAADPVST